MPSRLCSRYFPIELVNNGLNSFLVRVGDGHYARKWSLSDPSNIEAGQYGVCISFGIAWVWSCSLPLLHFVQSMLNVKLVIIGASGVGKVSYFLLLVLLLC